MTCFAVVELFSKRQPIKLQEIKRQRAREIDNSCSNFWVGLALPFQFTSDVSVLI